MNKIETEDIKELFAEWGLWSLIDDVSPDGDGHGDNLQLTKEGLEAERMINLLLSDQSQKQLKNKKSIEWKDGDILTTMDKNGLTHNFILNDMANLGKQDEKEKEELNLKLRKALKKDFNELYVKEYTTGWKEQRFLRNTELNIMSLENTKKYINNLILAKLFKKNK